MGVNQVPRAEPRLEIVIVLPCICLGEIDPSRTASAKMAISLAIWKIDFRSACATTGTNKPDGAFTAIPMLTSSW